MRVPTAIGLMVVDSAMIYSIVDVLLGGRRGTAAMRIEGRVALITRTRPVHPDYAHPRL